MIAHKRYKLSKASKFRITEVGRVCTICGEYKSWINYHIDKNNKTGYTSQCKECRNKLKAEYRKKEGIREKENQYKRDFRKTEKGKLRTLFDNIYYRDKIIKKNREILKKFNNSIKLRKQAKESKIYFFLNKGYDIEYLKKIYD